MSSELRVTIAVPPHRERHVAEINLYSDASPPEGYHETCLPIGEVTVDNGRLEFEIFVNDESGVRVFDCKEFVDALLSGMRRLGEMYPE